MRKLSKKWREKLKRESQARNLNEKEQGEQAENVKCDGGVRKYGEKVG